MFPDILFFMLSFVTFGSSLVFILVDRFCEQNSFDTGPFYNKHCIMISSISGFLFFVAATCYVYDRVDYTTKNVSIVDGMAVITEDTKIYNLNSRLHRNFKDGDSIKVRVYKANTPMVGGLLFRCETYLDFE